MACGAWPTFGESAYMPQPKPQVSNPHPIPGADFNTRRLRKKTWINTGDIILLSLRDFQDGKGDVIQKYSADEARSLKAYGELPETAKINETDTFGAEGDGDYGFEFGDEDSSEEEAGGKGGKEIDIDDI
jgi:translation initiation factor 1A